MTGEQHLTRRLEAAFGHIERERMADVPLLNDALRVQAVGFRDVDDANLGVLITPWFMNLMRMPAEGDDVGSPGEKRFVDLPAGRFEFIAGEEADIGTYQMCSLFSPVFEFADQATAVATAEAVMAQVMTPAAETEGSDDAAGRARVSRRGLLRGEFLAREGADR